MSTPTTDKDAAAAADKTAADAPKKSKGGALVALGSIILSAGISGAAAFAAVRFVGGPPTPPPVVVEHVAAKPPGPTVPLDAFVASVPDAAGQSHALKLTLAIALEHEAKAEEATPFVPRIRDSTLTYLRTRTHEDITGAQGIDAMRADLLERYEAAGLIHARKVLVTDLITQ